MFNFGGTFLRNDFEFGSVLEEKDVVYRYFLSLALVAIYSAMQNSLCNFKRGHFEKHFYEMDFQCGQVVQETLYKIFPIYILSFGAEPFRRYY